MAGDQTAAHDGEQAQATPGSATTIALVALAAVAVVAVSALVTVVVRRPHPTDQIATTGASAATSPATASTGGTATTSPARPVLSIALPPDGTTLEPGPVAVTVAVAGDPSTIERVVLLVDGAGAGTESTADVPIFTSLTTGSHTLAVKALLRDGAEVSSEPVTVVVTEPTTTTAPPTTRAAPFDPRSLGVLGLSTIELGMTLDDAIRATSLPYSQSRCGRGGSFDYRGDQIYVGTDSQGRVDSILVKTPTFATLSGVSPGSSSAAVARAYRDKGTLEQKSMGTPRNYQLVYRSSDPADAGKEVVFWVENEQVVSIVASIGSRGEQELC